MNAVKKLHYETKCNFTRIKYLKKTLKTFAEEYELKLVEKYDISFMQNMHFNHTHFFIITL